MRQERLLEILRETIIDTVRQDARDLTARQLAILLICCLEPDSPHTVRELAARLNIAKPAITRALDRLEGLDLVRRAGDPRDRRSVLAVATRIGFDVVTELKTVMARCAAQGGAEARSVAEPMLAAG